MSSDSTHALPRPQVRFSSARDGMLLAALPWSYAQLRLYDRLMFEEVAEVGGRGGRSAAMLCCCASCQPVCGRLVAEEVAKVCGYRLGWGRGVQAVSCCAIHWSLRAAERAADRGCSVTCPAGLSLAANHLPPLTCCHSAPALPPAPQVIKAEAHVGHLLDGADLLRLLWAYRVVRHRDALLHKRLVDRAVTQVGRRGWAG